MGFKFPAPLCDSWLTWHFQLDAGAGLFSDAGSSWLYLDCYTLELEDAYSDLPNVPVTIAGSVLEINDNDPFKIIEPKSFWGGFNVKAQKESALFVGLFIMIAANSGETMTQGQYQIFNMFPSLAPGVRYQLYPNEPPT